MKSMRIFSRAFAAAALIAATISCGDVVRSSRSPVMLVINNLQASRGAATVSQPGSNLVSDVFTLVTSGGVCTQAAPCPTIFADTGLVTLSLALKDIGMPADGLDRAAKLATENPYYNPRPVEYAGVRQLLENAFYGKRPA